MDKVKFKNNIVKAFNKVIKPTKKKCVVCLKLIDSKEFVNGKGACYKCWDR